MSEDRILFGPNYPENPYDWRFGHTFIPLEADDE